MQRSPDSTAPNRAFSGVIDPMGPSVGGDSDLAPSSNQSPPTGNDDAARVPNPIDIHVGARVKMLRRRTGISQRILANSLGLTFQQVQKYEQGTNRVSASKLYEIARFLEIPVTFFFEGLDDPKQMSSEEIVAYAFVQDFLMTNEGFDLAVSFAKVKNGATRRRLIELMKAVSEDDPPAE